MFALEYRDWTVGVSSVRSTEVDADGDSIEGSGDTETDVDEDGADADGEVVMDARADDDEIGGDDVGTGAIVADGVGNDLTGDCDVVDDDDDSECAFGSACLSSVESQVANADDAGVDGLGCTGGGDVGERPR